MAETFLLVDFENVREIPFIHVAPNWCVRIFIGRSQNTVPFALASEAQKLGTRLEWVKIEGDGRNNLDFHLAYYLGDLAARHPKAEYVILSKDKGFDPLLSHVTARGLQCRRIERIGAPPAVSSQSGDPNFDRAHSVLRKVPKNARPRRRKTLVQKVASDFQKKLPEAEVNRIVEMLFSKNLVSESNNALTYHF
jgi:hypothetical protein